MSLIAFVSGRSPGLTTAVHALAATWPSDRRAIVVELDPGGGTFAARHELPPEPGLTNLAVAGRRGIDPETVLRHCRRLPSGVVALTASVSPERVASALAVLGPELGPALDSIPGTDVLADCGRVERRSPTMELVAAAPYVVLVVTPSLEGVAHAHARLDSLPTPSGRVAVLTIGDRPYRPDEVGAALQLPVLGALAHDPAGAAQLNGTRPGRSTGRSAVRSAGRSAGRNDLRRSASVIARRLAGFLPEPGPGWADGPQAGPGSTDTLHAGPGWTDTLPEPGPGWTDGPQTGPSWTDAPQTTPDPEAAGAVGAQRPGPGSGADANTDGAVATRHARH